MSATPIFDLEQPPPEPPQYWLARLIGVVLGLGVVAITILADQNELPDWHWPAFNGLLLIPALYVAVALHELGHLVAGTLVGLDTGGISVGGFMLMKSGKNWVFRFDRRRWIGGFFKPLAGTGGLHRSRYSWMVAGGPLASIVLCLLCALIFAQYGNGLWDWIGSLYWTALFILVISAIPFSGGLNKSDGARLWQFIWYPERARSWMALVALQTEEAKGLLPRQWNAQLFDRILTVDASAGEYLYCQLMAFCRRLDQGSEADALEHLENALASSARAGKVMRHALFLEAASASANIRKRAAQARIWLERSRKLRKPEWLDAVEASIAMCEGRYEVAAKHWEAAQALCVRRKLDSGLIRCAKEKWAEYEEVCKARTDETGIVNAPAGIPPETNG